MQFSKAVILLLSSAPWIRADLLDYPERRWVDDCERMRSDACSALDRWTGNDHIDWRYNDRICCGDPKARTYLTCNVHQGPGRREAGGEVHVETCDCGYCQELPGTAAICTCEKEFCDNCSKGNHDELKKV